jgi:hypothetical protein
VAPGQALVYQHPDVGRHVDVNPAESRLGDTDDRVFVIPVPESSADRIGTRGVCGSPVVGADHGLERIGEAGARRVKDAASLGADAEHVEVVVRHELPARQPTLPVDGDLAGTEAPAATDDPRERSARLAQPVVRGDGELFEGARQVGPRFDETDELVGPLDRQVTHEQRLVEAEDGGPAADAQGQREDGRDRERRSSPEQARRVAYVLGRVLEPCPAPCVADAFLQRNRVAEIEARSPPRFALTQAVGSGFLRLRFEVELELGADLGLASAPTGQPPQPVQQSSHAPSPSAGFKTKSTARANVSHFVRAASSCRRPSAVSR